MYFSIYHWSCTTSAELHLLRAQDKRIDILIFLSLYFHITQTSCWMQHYPLGWRFFYSNFHKWILYLFVMLFWKKEKLLSSYVQKANSNAEIVKIFSKCGCSIWNALGLILSIFVSLLPQCTLSTSVSLIWVLSCTQKSYTHDDSPEKICLTGCLWKKPARRERWFSVCIFCLSHCKAF